MLQKLNKSSFSNSSVSQKAAQVVKSGSWESNISQIYSNWKEPCQSSKLDKWNANLRNMVYSKWGWTIGSFIIHSMSICISDNRPIVIERAEIIYIQWLTAIFHHECIKWRIDKFLMIQMCETSKMCQSMSGTLNTFKRVE